MATKEELIAQCRYYKGEKENPYDWSEENASNQFWEYEALFVHKYLHGTYGDTNPTKALNDYLEGLFIYLGDRYENTPASFRVRYYGGQI
ncbi:MAG: hypothetical protein SPJ13_01310 [Bacteroidales bacterium]|nr:hypothetical protein [Bacteroidales bacterium]